MRELAHRLRVRAVVLPVRLALYSSASATST